MSLARRTFLKRTAAALAGTAFGPGLYGFETGPFSGAKIRVGACVVDLEQAREAGIEGVEVRVGNAADRLEIADAKILQGYKDQVKKTGLPVCSLMMGLLNQCPLASDPRGPVWLEQSIDGAKDLGARVILVAFFGKGNLLGAEDKLKEADVDVVVERLKAAAPRAKDAGVVLAIENLLTAEQNARILDRVGHDAVKVYYDVYNVGVSKGYDVPAEIRFLKDRIVQFHFKNGKDFLEDRGPFFEAAAAAIKDIGYEGWIVLETSSPSKDRVADAKRNGEYVRRLFA